MESNNYKTGKLSPEDEQYLRDNYRVKSYSVIAKKLKRKTGAIANTAWRLGLKRTPEEQRAIFLKYNTGCYKIGHRPTNADQLKGRHLSPQTEFKKGQQAINLKPVGTITIRNDQRGVPYRWIKLSDGTWQPLHIHNYIKAYGPVPEGHIVVFRNKDTMNAAPNNLECITKAVNALRNKGYIPRPPVKPDLAPAPKRKYLSACHKAKVKAAEKEALILKRKQERKKQIKLAMLCLDPAFKEKEEAKQKKAAERAERKAHKAALKLKSQVKSLSNHTAVEDKGLKRLVKSIAKARQVQKQEAPPKISLVEKLKSMTYLERQEYFRQKNQDKVPVWLDEKTCVYRRAPKTQLL
ncbi:hypothetical protein AHMF7605_10335 [Adhaeribacter arboris]|uniref:HNH nuclease domain-containing protein n=1 Tax=Adhaeribacter arboris TaxID=2072846 RepID=A0A2T2YEE5_9BACT|nr:HNH endonuclease signature motif containing protein [Adhaeribacter arboris]PSR53885.1 hypothetical protein AHMF7605_10335 [Adhaeribacter arboris]